jgi:hypothetical protein
MLQDFDLINRFKVEKESLINFVNEIRTLYNSKGNQYHSFYHGFNVMHSAYVILTSTPCSGIFNPTEIFSLLIAGFVHDVDHTGRTNAFEISSASNLATLYHDISVLEQHHAAAAFFTMQQDSCNILRGMRPDDRKIFRKMMIHSILATDMQKHFPMITEMNTRFDDLEETSMGSNENDKDKISEMLIHIVDLSNSSKKFEICSRWSKAVNEEFSAQVQEERLLGLPVSEFMMGLDDPKIYYKNEMGFNKFVVRPLWVCFERWLNPHVTFMREQIDSNIERFQEELDKAIAEVDS